MDVLCFGHLIAESFVCERHVGLFNNDPWAPLTRVNLEDLPASIFKITGTVPPETFHAAATSTGHYGGPAALALKAERHRHSRFPEFPDRILFREANYDVAARAGVVVAVAVRGASDVAAQAGIAKIPMRRNIWRERAFVLWPSCRCRNKSM